MTRLALRVGDRACEVSVAPEPGSDDRFTVVVDGRRETVECRRLGDGRYSLVRPDAGHASHEVVVCRAGQSGQSGQSGELAVHVGPAAFTVTPVAPSHLGAGGAGPGDGEARIVAPMPGKVIQVLVAEGDQVEAGQGLVVVEAMKMENEIGAPRAGRITAVDVQPGTSVEAGRLLLVVG